MSCCCRREGGRRLLPVLAGLPLEMIAGVVAHLPARDAAALSFTGGILRHAVRDLLSTLSFAISHVRRHELMKEEHDEDKRATRAQLATLPRTYLAAVFRERTDEFLRLWLWDSGRRCPVTGARIKGIDVDDAVDLTFLECFLREAAMDRAWPCVGSSIDQRRLSSQSSSCKGSSTCGKDEGDKDEEVEALKGDGDDNQDESDDDFDDHDDDDDDSILSAFGSTDEWRRTGGFVLMYIARSGRTDLARRVLSVPRFRCIGVLRFDGDWALRQAVERRHASMCALLLEAYEDVMGPGKRVRDAAPVFMARERGLQDVLNVLVKSRLFHEPAFGAFKVADV